MSTQRRMADLQRILDLNDVRSADRANMKTILNRVRKSGELSYQEMRNVDAYITRYLSGKRTG